MKQYLIKILYFVLPILLFILLYVILDPFKVVKDYDRYLSDFVILQRGNTSTLMYLKNKDKYKYDSFIFGSSRSCAHRASIWQKYLPDTCVSFSFGSWSERIIGIHNRIQLIEKMGSDIDNVFIIVDESTFDNKREPLVGDHYLISKETRFGYHLYYFKKFLNLKMIYTAVDYRIFHKRRKYMTHFIGMVPEEHNPVNNDWLWNKVPKDTAEYYNHPRYEFYERPKTQQYFPVKIDPDEKAMLLELKDIFNRHHTNYKFILAPSYDQKKMNNADLMVMNEIFGKENIYDYSGINDITDNKYNFLDDLIHYRYRVGDRIFKEIYTKKNYLTKK